MNFTETRAKYKTEKHTVEAFIFKYYAERSINDRFLADLPNRVMDFF